MEYKDWIKIKKGDSQRDIDFKEEIKTNNRLADYLYYFGFSVMMLFSIMGFIFSSTIQDFLLYYTPGMIFFFGMAILSIVMIRSNYVARIVYILNAERKTK